MAIRWSLKFGSGRAIAESDGKPAADPVKPPNEDRPDYLDRPAELPALIGDCRISNIMYLIWLSRPDLQQAFDLATEWGQKAFVSWYLSTAKREYGITPYVPRSSQCHNMGAIEAKDTYTVVHPRATQGQPGANLIGYAYAELGMGEHVRMTAAALSTTDVKFGMYNFSWGTQSRQNASVERTVVIEENLYNANIFHINADQMLHAYCRLGREFLANRYNIGYWAWELAEIPNAWVPVLPIVDEIWAPSRFIQAAFAKRAKVPVVYMPPCVSLPVVERQPRRRFGLPTDSFLFLFTFDFFSYPDRKNPYGVIAAFRKAFTRDQSGVGLVLKTMNGHPASPGWLKLIELIDYDSRIYLLNNTMDREDVLALTECCDCFVSLHRSEGFGRGPAEAMWLGKPVIVTNYSGITDFVLADNACLVDFRLVPVGAGEYPHYENQLWAEPDLDQAAWYMRKVWSNSEFGREIGERAKHHIRKSFNPQTVGRRYADRLRKLQLV